MPYLEYLAAIAISAGFAWVIAGLGRPNGSIDRVVGAFASLIGGWRGDGWPIGVQEEDRDRPWGHAPAREAGDVPVQPVAVAPLVARTGLRR